jgi:hypothetical protein
LAAHADPVGEAVEKQESLTYPYKESGMALGQVILVTSESVPGLIQWEWAEVD